MNKNEFLMRLRKALASLPFEECQSAMKYYEEYFAEAGEDREGDILKELGSPEMLAATILGEYSSVPARTAAAATGYADAAYGSTSGYGESREQPQEPWYRRTPMWVLILLGICLSPIIVSFIGAVVAAISALFGLIVAVAGIVASLGVVGIGLLISGIVTVVVGAIRIALNPAGGILTMGIGMLFAAIGMLTIVATIWLFVNVAPPMVRWFVALVRRIFNRGGASQ